VNNRRKRLEGGGNKPFDVGLEDELLEWVHERRSSGLRVSRAMIHTKRELFMSKNARQGRFLHLLLQVMLGPEVCGQEWAVCEVQNH